MKSIQSLFSGNQFPLRLKPAFIAERKLVDLFGQMKLQLFTAFHQRSAELQKMLLDQAGRCSEGHAAGQERTVRILAQGLVSSFAPPAARCSSHQDLALMLQQQDQAKRGIDLSLFLFSDQDLADVLAIRRKQSVQIRVLVDLVFAHRSCFEWIDLQCQPAAVYCCRLEAGNNPWTNPLRNVVTPG